MDSVLATAFIGAQIGRALLSQNVAGQALTNQIIEEVQVSAHGG